MGSINYIIHVGDFNLKKKYYETINVIQYYHVLSRMNSPDQ